MRGYSTIMCAAIALLSADLRGVSAAPAPVADPDLAHLVLAALVCDQCIELAMRDGVDYTREFAQGLCALTGYHCVCPPLPGEVPDCIPTRR